MRKIAAVIVVGSLLACITNYVPLSIMVAILFPLSIAGLCYRYALRFSKTEVCLLALYAWVIASVLLYNPASLLEFDFYRKDGNFFISYGVLFVFLFLPFSIDIDIHRWTVRAFVFFLLLSFVGFALMPGEVTEEGRLVHHFFFVSHNAAGGFYSVIGAIALGLYIQTRKKGYLFFTVCFLFFLYETDSRGSQLAFIAAAGYGFFGFRKPVVVFTLFVLAQFAIVIDTYPAWVQMGKVMSDLSLIHI